MNHHIKKEGAVNPRVVFSLSVVLVFIFALAYFFYSLQPNSQGEVMQKQFVIEKGDGFRDIGASLSKESLISSIAVFKAYALLTGKAQRFQPGTYELSNVMSIPQILDTLTSKKRSDVLVTIPEGSTLKDIDALLAEAGVLQEESLSEYRFQKLKSDYPFLASASSLEGFLFPDSYFFDLGSSEEIVVRRMLDNFSKKAWPMLSGIDGWYDRLILASFLEREVISFEDRQIVSGILLKRIALKMPLQVDATISYAKCDGKTKNCENLRVLRSDLDYASPYNTYKRFGWTPTPISNPGEVAIKAATTPVESPYLYYLSAQKTKETYFSKTLEEHNKNRAKYL